ncbi:protein takeout [Drosophila grimshawi]|uniref:GH17381 n=1 Tax=Drosophila grimshawi TaxID=7222 RepID=B4JV12_DROGR|nr:protein takeout [Drosophila grimshawi]EDV91332.1 GH17381 [Drosophila grimshawi]
MSRITCIAIFCAILTVQAKFPNDPKACKYGDGECIVKFINDLVSKKSATGDRDINLVQIDPLPVAKLQLKQGEDSPVNIDLTFTDNKLVGLSTMTYTKVKGFGKNLAQKHELLWNIKKISVLGPYTISGKVLILPISGNGVSNMTMVNAEAKTTFIGKPIEKNGETYMDVTNFKLYLNPERIYYHFTNLFNGDKALGDNMNAFLNDNWEAIFGEVKLSLESAFGEVYHAIIRNVFTKYPYDKYFID